MHLLYVNYTSIKVTKNTLKKNIVQFAKNYLMTVRAEERSAFNPLWDSGMNDLF